MKNTVSDYMFHVDKQFSHANNACTIRFTEELYKELKDLAKKENVSFNNLVLQCCAYALRERGQDSGLQIE